MELIYRSTRNANETATASQAILKGLANEGGLFVPDSIPALDVSLEDLAKMNYQQVAYEVMKLMFTDFTEAELKHCIDSAYDSKFDTPVIAPLVNKAGAYYLELFHGSTIAFKDMALSILPYLLTTSAKKNGVKNEIVILTATSGDTGKAALAGFADVPGTKIIVFYPKHGVSPIQEKQMVTQKGDNTFVVGITGNFDDAQTGVKKMFSDAELAKYMDEKGYQFSSANSINIGRLVPQMVYYVYAYTRLVADGTIKAGDKINVDVPTGNFGNILAAYYAKEMGLPIAKFICASNDNKVLFDFFQTGTYDRNREFILTTSPSMDILISSNLERLIYKIAGNDAEKNSELMKELTTDGVYTITDDMKAKLAEFYGGYATEAETAATIATGKLGIFHGMKSYFCQDEYGQIAPVYSISAGLDYPGIGPEHAHLYDTGRAEYVPVTDEEAVEAFEYLSRTEGIIPAIESAHAVAYAKKIVPQMRKDQIVVITISGRGDKDCAAIARYRGEDIHE